MSNGRRPPWAIETAIEAKSAADAERLEGALQEISAANPTIGYSMDPGALAALVLATDEAQLDATLATLKRRCGGTVTVGSPQIRYRGALARTVDVDYTHKKLTASGGEFARVKLKIEPGGPGAGCAFRSEIVGGVVPDKFIGGVEQGVRSVCRLRRAHRVPYRCHSFALRRCLSRDQFQLDSFRGRRTLRNAQGRNGSWCDAARADYGRCSGDAGRPRGRGVGRYG